MTNYEKVINCLQETGWSNESIKFHMDNYKETSFFYLIWM